MLYSDQNNPTCVSTNTFSTASVLYLCSGLTITICALSISLINKAESTNQLRYQDSLARKIAGMIKLITCFLHADPHNLEINTDESQLIAIGPHRTGWEAFVVVSNMRGQPPRFMATDMFNQIPGVANFFKLFNVILVKADNQKMAGNSANAIALEEASQVLENKGCLALFPQGNYSRIQQDPHIVYNGTANLAIKHNLPIHVLRLDGFWSLQNPWIPMFIRNSVSYRAFFSFLHLNNVRITHKVINVHLEEDNKTLSVEEKRDKINTALYAYFRHTPDLTEKQINQIEKGMSNHLNVSIWQNKSKQQALQKELKTLQKDMKDLESEYQKMGFS